MAEVTDWKANFEKALKRAIDAERERDEARAIGRQLYRLLPSPVIDMGTGKRYHEVYPWLADDPASRPD